VRTWHRRVFAGAALSAVAVVALVVARSSAPQAPTVAARALLAETTAGVARYRDPAVALADGYHPATLTRSLIREWINPMYAKAGPELDPRHPARLVYVTGPTGPVLAGAMYVMPSVTLDGPGCFLPTGAVAGANGYGFACPALAGSRKTSAMLHVWVVYNPAGPFAEDLSPRVIVRLLDGT
jgi:hypothetical protein